MRTLGSERDQAEMRRRLGEVTASDTRRWGTMSAGEMVCHLRGAFRMALGEVVTTPLPQKLPGGVIKLLALWMPVRWPQGMPTVAELDRGQASVEPGWFAQDRSGLMDAFEEFAAKRENRTTHPIFGPMRPREWMRWGYLHTDHHLRQFGR